MQKHKTILLDMDDVVVDLKNPWTKAYNKLYDDDLSPGEFFKTWDIHTHVKCGEAVYDIIKQPGFFEDLPSIENSIDGVKELMLLGRVILASAISDCGEIAKGKMIWIRKYLPFFDPKDVILCGAGSRKPLVRGNLLIDDNVKTLIEWQYLNDVDGFYDYSTILVEAPSNIGCSFEPTYRVKNWEQIIEAAQECLAMSNYT